MPAVFVYNHDMLSTKTVINLCGYIHVCICWSESLLFVRLTSHMNRSPICSVILKKCDVNLIVSAPDRKGKRNNLRIILL